MNTYNREMLLGVVTLGMVALTPGTLLARTTCDVLPGYAALKDALESVVDGDNAGLGNEMWAATVDRDGNVCAVAFSGEERSDQWPGSRNIAAQKANTANAFSLPSSDAGVGFGAPLASGNLYGLVQPGGSLFGLQASNPVDPRIAYRGAQARFGQSNDPMVGKKIGGVNVFGGGLALYDSDNGLVGGLGVSGDTSCTDHITAWRLRDALGLDFVPGGVGDGGTNDNLIIADPVTPNTFEHPNCGDNGEVEIIETLADAFPIETP